MQPGDTLAHYEIRAPLGKGGMGEVFLATDTKLGRDVALKILPEDFAKDKERLARFRREAQVLASLNHPNISAIYGLEEDGGVHFLAMELMKGSDLAAHLKAGRIPEDEAVEIIRRIAEGLSEAHRNGIMHRDLKPANVMLTPDGTVKILDFGLARAYTGDVEDSTDPAFSPTITAAMTQAGTILGTAAYMAPEQARGKRVDNRADIWAMGAILFEMLAGRRLFEGETVSDVLASVIKVEPDLESLPKGTSPQVRRMLRRCLQHDPRQRLHSAADAVLELDEEFVEAAAAPSQRRSPLPWILVGVLVIAIFVGWFRPTDAPRKENPRQYDLQLPNGAMSTSAYRPLVSPDGNWIALTLSDSLNPPRILLRSLETGTHFFADNTDGAGFPFWSPDSRFLGFFQQGRMRKLHIESGTVQLITAEVENLSRGASWSPDGKILYAPGANDALRLVNAAGGQARVVTVVDSTMVDGSHRWPQFLPDGRRFVFTQWSNVLAERSEKGGIFLGSLDGGEPRRLLRDVSASVVSLSGHLLFHRNGRLMGVPFDIDSGEVTGEPRLISTEVAFQDPNGLTGVSANDRGDLFISVHNPDSGLNLGWSDRQGQQLTTITQDLPLALSVDLSRDGRHYSVELIDDVGSVEIWIGDLERDSISRLSRFDSDCWGPVFSPDGRDVIYGVQTISGGNLYRHEISGAQDPERILEFDNFDLFVTARHWFAPDQVLVVRDDHQTKTTGIFLLDLGKKELSQVLLDQFDQNWPRLSPDGRWLAYVSNESGIPEVYVRNWPDLNHKWQVSREGGIQPHWREDGSELIFSQNVTREVNAVEFDGAGAEPRISLPHKVVSMGQNVTFVTHTPDHERFLVGFSSADPELPPVKVLVGWGQDPH
jgi:serine/threonine protein kinase